MIPRYTRPEMASIWEPQTRFKIWFEIEAHAADAQAELGVIPKEAARTAARTTVANCGATFTGAAENPREQQ